MYGKIPSPYTIYSEEIEQILATKDYSDDIKNMVRLSLPIIIKKFGSENMAIIFSTLKIVQIQEAPLGKTLLLLLKEHENSQVVDDPSAIANDSAKAMSIGMYESNPFFSISEKNVINLQKVTRYVLLHSGKVDLEKFAAFVHEFGHAIKSTRNEYSISHKDGQDTLMYRNGLINNRQSMSLQDNKIQLKIISSVGTGLEEGINTMFEEDIVNEILSMDRSDIPENLQGLFDSIRENRQEDSEYKSSAYGPESTAARALFKLPGFPERIISDELYGTSKTASFYDSIIPDDNKSENSWYLLLQGLDDTTKYNYLAIQSMFDRNKLIENMQKRMTAFSNVATQIVDMSKFYKQKREAKAQEQEQEQE